MASVQHTTNTLATSIAPHQDDIEKLSSKVEQVESIIVSVFIRVFPDVICLLELPSMIPFLSKEKSAFFKRISKNLDPICICIIASTVAITIITSSGLFFFTMPLIKFTLLCTHISASTAATLLSGAYIKKFLKLQRNHQEVQVVEATVEMLRRKIENLNTANTEHAKANAAQREANLELEGIREGLQSDLAAHKSLTEEREAEYTKLSAIASTTIDTLNSQNIFMEKAHAAFKESEPMLRAAEEKLATTDKKLATTDKKLATTDKKLAATIIQLSNLTPTVAHFTASVADLQKTASALKSENQERAAQNKILETTTDQLATRQQEVADETKKLQAASELLVKILKQVEQAANKLNGAKKPQPFHQTSFKENANSIV